MEKNIQQLPGYRVKEYKLVLVPHSELTRHILEVRKAFNDKFSIENPTGNLPQVLLASFRQIQAAEDRILNRLRLIAMAGHAFKVEMKDFGSFPSHTIFINVPARSPWASLSKRLRPIPNGL